MDSGNIKGRVTLAQITLPPPQPTTSKMSAGSSSSSGMDFSFISALLWNPPPIITRQGDVAVQGWLWRGDEFSCGGAIKAYKAIVR